MQNIPEVKTDWDIKKVKLKQKYMVLSDEDLVFEPGKQEDMMQKLQTKLGKTKGDLIKIIEEL